MTPVKRNDYLFRGAVEMGIPPWGAREAIASVALSHEPGWLDEMVNPETGEVEPRDPPTDTSWLEMENS